VTDASKRLHNGNFTEGVVRGVETVGEQLAVDFPAESTTDVTDRPMTWTSVGRQGRFPVGTGIAVAAARPIAGTMLDPLTLLP
jgi:hypothetical protein